MPNQQQLTYTEECDRYHMITTMTQVGRHDIGANNASCETNWLRAITELWDSTQASQKRRTSGQAYQHCGQRRNKEKENIQNDKESPRLRSNARKHTRRLKGNTNQSHESKQRSGEESADVLELNLQLFFEISFFHHLDELGIRQLAIFVLVAL